MANENMQLTIKRTSITTIYIRCRCPQNASVTGRSTRTQTIGSTINWSTNGAGIGRRKMNKYTSELVEITHDEYVPTETLCQDETV